MEKQGVEGQILNTVKILIESFTMNRIHPKLAIRGMLVTCYYLFRDENYSKEDIKQIMKKQIDKF
jgi:hypothetical protein